MNFTTVQYEIYALAFALAFLVATTVIEEHIRVERWSGLARAAYKLVLLVATIAFFFAPARMAIVLAAPLGLPIWAGIAAAVGWCLACLPAMQLVQNATRACRRRPTKPIRWLPDEARRGIIAAGSPKA